VRREHDGDMIPLVRDYRCWRPHAAAGKHAEITALNHDGSVIAAIITAKNLLPPAKPRWKNPSFPGRAGQGARLHIQSGFQVPADAVEFECATHFPELETRSAIQGAQIGSHNVGRSAIRRPPTNQPRGGSHA